MKDPFKNVYAGMALDGERLIRKILERLEGKQLEADKVSQRKDLLATAKID